METSSRINSYLWFFTALVIVGSGLYTAFSVLLTPEIVSILGIEIRLWVGGLLVVVGTFLFFYLYRQSTSVEFSDT